MCGLQCKSVSTNNPLHWHAHAFLSPLKFILQVYTTVPTLHMSYNTVWQVLSGQCARHLKATKSASEAAALILGFGTSELVAADFRPPTSSLDKAYA